VQLFYLRILFVSIIGALTPKAQTFITFDPPGSAGTVPTAINDAGEVVGFYFDAGGASHGFVRNPDGTFTSPLTAPGGYDVRPNTINAAGTIAGRYKDKAFIRVPNGAYSTLRFPPTTGVTIAIATSIDNAGFVVGSYSAKATKPGLGFIRGKDRSITLFSVPDASLVIPTGVNRDGTSAGYYYVADTVVHGFVRDAQGVITTFDPPGSTQTLVAGISASGVVAGQWLDGLAYHGFLRDEAGLITTFDPPGSTGTQVFGINAGGSVIGFASDASGGHAFVRGPFGKFTTVEFPGSSFTWETGINLGGAVTGYYIGSDSVLHGFISQP
jgi:uncharacterized membrane protein